MKTVSNNIDVKIANAAKIYTVLRGSGDMTKSQLSGVVGLSFASVSNMCGTLEKAGLVSVTENVKSTGGRKAARVAFTADHAYTLAIDLHHTHHGYVGLVDLRNQVRDRMRFEILPGDPLEAIMEKIRDASGRLCPDPAVRLLGVCVGISAVHDPSTGIVMQSSNPVFEQVNVHRCVSELFPGKVVLVDNDANLAGLSQMMQSDGTQKNLLFIFFTQGIGLGIMIHGVLYRGTNGYAGELGHIKVAGISKICKCGATGCLRTVATLESIAQDLGEFAVLNGLDESSQYAKSLADRYAAGESAVVQRIDLTAMKIGEVMAELFDLFNPQEIVLGGNMGELFPYIKQGIRQHCRDLSNLARAVDLQIRYLDLPTYELVLSGAGERMFHHWIEYSFPKFPRV